MLCFLISLFSYLWHFKCSQTVLENFIKNNFPILREIVLRIWNAENKCDSVMKMLIIYFKFAPVDGDECPLT